MPNKVWKLGPFGNLTSRHEQKTFNCLKSWTLDGGNGDVSSQVLFFSSMPKYINYEKQLNDNVSTPISQTAVANDSKTQDRCFCMVHWIEGKKKCPPRLLYRWCAQWLLFSNEQYAQSHSWLDSIWPVSDIQSWNGSLHRVSKFGSGRASLRFQKSLKGVCVCGRSLLPLQAVGTLCSRFVWKQTNTWWVSPLCPPPS